MLCSHPWQSRNTSKFFGTTGSGFADLFQPGLAKGKLTNVQLVGKNSPHPDSQLWGDDYNNFSPAVGLSWAAPTGENGVLRSIFGKTPVLRMGYGWSYERASLRIVDVIGGDLPGLRSVTTFQSGNYLDLKSAAFPLTPTGLPLATVPIDERTQTMRGFDTNLRTPYTQNWNVSLQRELSRSLTLEVRYVGSKGSKLINGINVNERNIFETGILDAFKITQAGGNALLFDTIFKGLNISGLGTVDGAKITGSDVIRFNSTTAGYIANNDVGSLANFLWTTTSYTNQVGGLPRRAGFPENWVAANPQFTMSRLTTNSGSSTYHSLQVEVNKRFGGGWAYQANYTFSKAMGEEEGAGQEQNMDYRALRNKHLNHRILSFSYGHAFRSNGTYDLPIGPGRKFLNSHNGFLSRLAEQWTLGVIYNKFSGQPLSISSGANSYNTAGSNTPMLVGNFPKSTGEVTMTGTGPVYFAGFTQVADPYIANITPKNSVASTRFAIKDPSGAVVLSNPLPGQLGSLGSMYITGPSSFRLDANLIKRIHITEGKSFEMRATAINLTNTPQWNNPNVDINSTNFGRITSTLSGTAGGNRIMVIEVRVNW